MYVFNIKLHSFPRSASSLPLPSYLCLPSPTLLAPFPSLYVVAWTWHRWLGCGALGRNYPASTRSCLETCRMSSTRPGTWQSTATSWAARACSRPSSHCSRWWRRTSPSYMKVDGQNFFIMCIFVCVLAPHFLYLLRPKKNWGHFWNLTCHSAQFNVPYFLCVERKVNFSLTQEGLLLLKGFPILPFFSTYYTESGQNQRNWLLLKGFSLHGHVRKGKESFPNCASCLKFSNGPAWLDMKDHFDLLEDWQEGDQNKEIFTLKIQLRNIVANWILQMSQNINH